MEWIQKAAADLTTADALRGPTPNQIAKQIGRGQTITTIYNEVVLANKLTGNGMEPDVLTLCAEMIFDRWKYRPLTGLRLAFYRGINGGKMFGKLTYPVLSQWMEDMEEAIEDHNYQAHLATK